MRDWRKREPIVIVSGKGAVLRDTRGRKYLDANSSIWTNLHGHRHPAINAAIARQLGKIAHSSALGLANEPASRLAAKLVRAGRRRKSQKTQMGLFFRRRLDRDGSGAEDGMAIRRSHRAQPAAEIFFPCNPLTTATPWAR